MAMYYMHSESGPVFKVSLSYKIDMAFATNIYIFVKQPMMPMIMSPGGWHQVLVDPLHST